MSSRENYGNKKIGANCQIDDTETPEDAFMHLAYWVKEQFIKIGMNPPEIYEANNKLIEINSKIEKLESEYESMRLRWKKAAEFLEKHGVKVPENEIPF